MRAEISSDTNDILRASFSALMFVSKVSHTTGSPRFKRWKMSRSGGSTTTRFRYCSCYCVDPYGVLEINKLIELREPTRDVQAKGGANDTIQCEGMDKWPEL